jgi:hypothetical protein
MLNTYIYHQLPATCFGVCYTFFSKTNELFAQELYAVCMLLSGCATEYKAYTVF